MTAALEKVIEQVRSLSAGERDELREWMDAAPSDATPEDEFARKLLEAGVGQPRPAGPRSPNSEPIRVEGRPLSEELIEERRRGYDALQLAAARAADAAARFVGTSATLVSADVELNAAAAIERLTVEDPNSHP